MANVEWTWRDECNFVEKVGTFSGQPWRSDVASQIKCLRGYLAAALAHPRPWVVTTEVLRTAKARLEILLREKK